MQVSLVMFRADGERRNFVLNRDVIVVGRREDCDMRIPLGEVSRKHCRFVKEGPTLRLEDLGSSNGTFVNGKRVQDTILEPGDSVQIGPVVFGVQIEGEPPEDQLHPVIAAEETPSQHEPADALAPTAQSEVPESGEFDPLEALDPNEQSDFDVNLIQEEADRAGAPSPIDLEQTQPRQE